MKPSFERFPILDEDLFAPEVLADSYPMFRRIRDLGDAAWVPRISMFVVGRFKDVQAGLRASDALISGEGVSANEAVLGEAAQRGPTSVLTMDGQEHLTHKQLLMKPLMPGALQSLKDRLAREAAEIVRATATGVEFEAMSTLASHLPIRIVSKMIGLTDVGHERLLRWSAAAFDCFGPADNPLTQAAGPTLFDFLNYGFTLSPDAVVPGGWAAGLFEAVERGEIPMDRARAMVFDYATPSLDTTILAVGEMLWRLATVEGAFDAVRANPALITPVVYESVRMATPIRGFTRHVRSDFALSDNVLPAGSRVFLLNASANRDERHYRDPDRFDITRNPRDNLGWGHGKHVCVGMHLARLEMETLLGELVRSVRAIEAGTPTRLVNNGLHGYHRLPLILHPA